jgi:hypothetical protein
MFPPFVKVIKTINTTCACIKEQFALKSFLLANENTLDEAHGSWFMESLESGYKQCFFKNMISTYTKDFS